jgi:hypothetical protein
MPIELLLNIVKYAGIALAGAFGALGVLTQTRDKEGALTPWGRLAFAGVVVSTLVSLAAQTLEIAAGARKAEEDRQQALRLLLEIRRGQQPLHEVEAGAWARCPVAARAELGTYGQRVEKEYPKEFKQRFGFDPGPRLGRLSLPGLHSLPEFPIYLTPGERLFPTTKEEPLVHQLLAGLHAEFFFYKGGGDEPEPDPSFQKADLFFGIEVESDQPGASLAYYPESKVFVVGGSKLVESRRWRSQGTLIAVADLPGARMAVQVSPRGALPSASPFGVHAVSLQVAGQGVWLTADDLAAKRSANGAPYATFTFPDTEDGVRRLGMERRQR